MVRQHSILIACLGVLAPASSTADKGGPGTIPLDLGAGKDSYWIDTDGVAPEVAGCHIEYSDSKCTSVAAHARNFGELCQADGTLIESNPAALECHTHEHDVGDPYVVDCVAWCKGTLTLPNGDRRRTAATTGKCEVVRDLPCDQGRVDSARCVCQ